MIFDTDVLIWALKGNKRAAEAIDAAKERHISVINYMELICGARDKAELRAVRSFLKDMGFSILPLTENLGLRASVYLEEYFLATGLSLADALLAATAVAHQLAFLTGNARHFKRISELTLKTFRP